MAKAGQPTKYLKKYNAEIIDLARQGKGISHFAAHCDCARDTLYEWARNNPEFSDTLKKAAELRENWWVNCAMNQADGSSRGNANITKFMLGCNFGYKDANSQATQVTVSDGKVDIAFTDVKPDEQD
jgi:hypothetical protein